MKLPITNFKFRIPIKKKSAKPAAARRAHDTGHSPFAIRHSPLERGFALVITLILLSVTLIMAVAFLAISRRERGSVVTTTDTATARLAADSALASAEAQIMSSVLATTNPYINNLLVSTNYINADGFIANVANPTNVNYDHYNDGGSLSVGDFLQNVANLQYLPRAPVYVPTNNLGSNDFRFYLDLNRNGKFEDSGAVTNYDNLGNVILDNSGNATAFQMGDPQWIGVLERPDAPHGPNNKFVARYAFIALPADNELDLNAIHNQAYNQTVTEALNSANDAYFRNQGVGSWEINLAAFLADLNTNEWDTTIAPYNYRQPALPNNGFAFQDAFSLLSYRYNFNYKTLASLQATLGAQGYLDYANGLIDSYSAGNLMTGFQSPFLDIQNNGTPWAGADNTNHYFALASDLYDPTKVENNVIAPGFIERLNQASITNSTYDRYTFYRLLAQLGTDSSPESGKMNLNYDNLTPFRNGIYDTNAGVASVTNFVAWTPLAFFTNAADRMLRLYTTNWFQGNSSGFYTNYTTVTNLIYVAPSNYLATYYGIQTNYFSYIDAQGRYIWNDPSGFGLTNVPLFGMTNQIPAFGVTNIPVYINGQYVYSSAVQRVLQLAANIFDATTNNLNVWGANFPSVFRPLFAVDAASNIFIVNFTNLNSALGPDTVSGTNDLQLSIPFDAATIAALNGGHLPRYYPSPLVNIYGVPWIIGAKKGFPNFNEFAMQSAFQITRKLRLTRGGTDISTYPISTYTIDQLFNCSISNQFQVECWNSYYSNYTRPTTITVSDHIQMVLTNDQQVAQPLWYPLDAYLYASITTNNWTGIAKTPISASFLLTSPTNLLAIALPTATYKFLAPDPNTGFYFQLVGTNTEPTYENNQTSLPQPHWGLLATNNLQVVMIDNLSGRVIDYVQMRGPITRRDLTAEIFTLTNPTAPPLMWFTNPVPSKVIPPKSLPAGVENQLEASQTWVPAYWPNQQQASVQPQIDGFNRFIGQLHDNQLYGSTNLQIQAAYTPTATAVQITYWRANDPLVHYLASDLYDSANGNILTNIPYNSLITVMPNERYQPWGRSVQMAALGNVDQSRYNLAFKDPLVWSSDHWDFPTNQFPTVGWLGRVHRGTPWQTVYLKASNILKEGNGVNTWVNWTGNLNTNDAANAGPLQDRLLFDIFTTAINDNATRGQLSVNVAANTNDIASGLAAWSAAFSGVMVLSNNLPDDNPKAGAYTLSTFHSYNPLLTVPSYAAFPANPAGANGMSSPLGQVVADINQIRAQYTNADGVGGAFEHVGDILSAPALTEQSPFLHISNLVVNASGSYWTNDFNQITNGISDEMYEWLPQQTLSLLRAPGNPRYVIYCYGQALRPAPNGVVTSGGQAYFGMVTNYQVVAESATRAVVQFQPVVVTNSLNGAVSTNYNATIEQFNPLPPD